MSLRTNPDFHAFLKHLEAEAERHGLLHTLANLVFPELQRMSKELDDFRAQMGTTETSVSALTSEVQTLSAKHDTVSASHDEVTAERDELKSALVDATATLKTMADGADQAVSTAKAAGTADADVGHQPDSATLVQSLGASETSAATPEQEYDPNTGLPIARSEPLNEPA